MIKDTLFSTEEMPLPSIQDMHATLNEIKMSSENVRRGLFARHNELTRIILRQQEEIEHLKENVRRLAPEKEQWVYCQNDKLFDRI